jgi:uncharacterized protein YjbI with pentapeptide repeats
MHDKEKEEESAAERRPATGGCPVAMHDGKPCGRDVLRTVVVNGIPVCMMHLNAGRDAAAFREEFERILKEAGTGIADFTRFVFPAADYAGRAFVAKCVFTEAAFTQGANFSGARFTQGADFSGTRFSGDAEFYGVTFAEVGSFSGAKFGGKSTFQEATFSQEADFKGATFRQKANFREARFRDGADFAWARFAQTAWFSVATFAQSAKFVRATFSGDVAFSFATFTQDADFSLSTYAEGADFYLAQFGQGADFSGATFMQGANFSEAAFTRGAVFSNARFLGSVAFRETTFREDGTVLPGAVFSLAEFAKPEAVVFYKSYLGQALFHNCDVSKFVFSSVRWRRRKGSGKGMVLEEDIDLGDERASDIEPEERSPDERDYGLIAELYQQLKKNYDDRKDYWTAGDFHYGEMEMKRLSSRRTNPVLRWLHRYLGLAAWYKYVSQYGESYLRPLLVLGLVLLIFTLLYPTAGLRYSLGKDQHVASAASATDVLTYGRPFLPGKDYSGWFSAEGRLFGNSLLTALDVAAFQKERAFEPVYPWGRVLALVEMLFTSTFFALLVLALRRQFRR